MDVPLALTERSETLFSPGRQQLVDRILADLLAGYIDTGIDPETGSQASLRSIEFRMLHFLSKSHSKLWVILSAPPFRFVLHPTNITIPRSPAIRN